MPRIYARLNREINLLCTTPELWALTAVARRKPTLCTGVDEADNWEPVHRIEPPWSLYVIGTHMTTPRRFRRPDKRIISGFGTLRLNESPSGHWIPAAR